MADSLSGLHALWPLTIQQNNERFRLCPPEGSCVPVPLSYFPSDPLGQKAIESGAAQITIQTPFINFDLKSQVSLPVGALYMNFPIPEPRSRVDRIIRKTMQWPEQHPNLNFKYIPDFVTLILIPLPLGNDESPLQFSISPDGAEIVLPSNDLSFNLYLGASSLEYTFHIGHARYMHHVGVTTWPTGI